MQSASPLVNAWARSKWPLLWLATLLCACILAWRMGSGGTGALDKAQNLARSAVELSLSGSSKAKGLAGMMTPEAFARAQAERKASGLDEALAQSGSSLVPEVYPLEVSTVADGWQVKGLAKASLAGGSATGPDASWRGAWSVKISSAGAEPRVSRLRISSLPEGAAFDASGLGALRDQAGAP